MTDQSGAAEAKRPNFIQVLLRPWTGDWAINLYTAMLIGFVVVILHGAFAGWQLIFSALLLSGAMLLIGIFLGFLFGIPRAVQSDAPATVDPATGQAVRGFQANTNLEQISDWLTKILVGVGLTQLTTIPTHISTFGSTFKGAVGGWAPEPFTISIGLFFSIVGFMIGYLWTRLDLERELVDAAREAAEAARQAKVVVVADNANVVVSQPVQQAPAPDVTTTLPPEPTTTLP